MDAADVDNMQAYDEGRLLAAKTKEQYVEERSALAERLLAQFKKACRLSRQGTGPERELYDYAAMFIEVVVEAARMQDRISLEALRDARTDGSVDLQSLSVLEAGERYFTHPL